MATLEEVHAFVERYTPSGGESYYRLEGATVVLDQVCRCIVRVVDENGVPIVGQPVLNFWPGNGALRHTNAAGEVEFFFGPEAKFWPPNAGPHAVVVGTHPSSPSDVVKGMGLPEGRHADYQLLFVRRTGEPPAPPDAPPAGDVEYIELGHVDIGRLRITASWRK